MESKLKVKLISHTPEPDKIVTAAAKLCYSKSGVDEIMENLDEQKINKFLDMLTDIKHESPIEHVSFTFAVEGVSRTLTHQLVRHRIASYSQQSQRYVKLDQFEYIIPPAIAKNSFAKQIYEETMKETQIAYDSLVAELLDDLIIEFLYKKERVIEYSPIATIYGKQMIRIDYMEKHYPKDLSQLEKKAIEDARYVFPNACETKIMLTMNARSLMNFFSHRCCNRAQWEIRALAHEMLKQVKEVAPVLFKNAGASCLRGKCPEGKMSCGKPYKKGE